jgi:hypothetical protein
MPGWRNTGLYGTGIVVDKFGYRKTMIRALFHMIGFIFIPLFSRNLQVGGSQVLTQYV